MVGFVLHPLYADTARQIPDTAVSGIGALGKIAVYHYCRLFNTEDIAQIRRAIETCPTMRAKGGGFGPKNKATYITKREADNRPSPQRGTVHVDKDSADEDPEIMSMEHQRYPCGMNNEIDAEYLANGRNATTDEISLSGDASEEVFDDEANNEFEEIPEAVKHAFPTYNARNFPVSSVISWPKGTLKELFG
ncbi:hypothetical protein GQ600_25147 [Phytophthora cactorum]|nr:hypothetical protein GQ600_25147 [Phytophthora cactorum]